MAAVGHLEEIAPHGYEKLCLIYRRSSYGVFNRYHNQRLYFKQQTASTSGTIYAVAYTWTMSNTHIISGKSLASNAGAILIQNAQSQIISSIIELCDGGCISIQGEGSTFLIRDSQILKGKSQLEGAAI